MKNIWEVADIEVFPNLFTYTGYDLINNKWNVFTIHPDGDNDYNKLIDHLTKNKHIMIGYNIDGYDYPVLHHLINHRMEYSEMSPGLLTNYIYDKSQNIINSDFNTVADRNKHFMVIDLFTMWHFNNVAKLTSLKDLEIAMRMESVEDFDMDFDERVPLDRIQDVLRYNKNDVLATLKFFMITLGKTDNPLYKGKNKLLLRQRIFEKYGLSGFSYDDIKLGTELILKMYLSKVNEGVYNYNDRVTEWNIKKAKGTQRNMIVGSTCIPKWANLKSPVLQKTLHQFENAIFFDGITKGVLSFSAIFQGFKIDYGAGGAHGCIKPGVYDSDDEWLILDVDISSMYPNLAITQGIYPKHLGPKFLETYGDDIVGVRMAEKAKEKKLQDFVVIEGFKLAANGTYGKTKEKSSWLYDPLYPIKTTISGQILLTMWMERMVEVSPDLIFIQINTKLPLVL